MTTLNITTLKMIMAVVGTLVFLTIFSLTAPHQELSLKTCTTLNDKQACLPYNNSQTGKNG
jgi:uncharacterized membrane protein YjfL (UPF0719 family)